MAGHVGLELANVILKKPLKMLGEFSLDYGTFWDQRLFACELLGDGHAASAGLALLDRARPTKAIHVCAAVSASATEAPYSIQPSVTCTDRLRWRALCEEFNPSRRAPGRIRPDVPLVRASHVRRPDRMDQCIQIRSNFRHRVLVIRSTVAVPGAIERHAHNAIGYHPLHGRGGPS